MEDTNIFSFCCQTVCTYDSALSEGRITPFDASTFSACMESNRESSRKAKEAIFQVLRHRRDNLKAKFPKARVSLACLQIFHQTTDALQYLRFPLAQAQWGCMGLYTSKSPALAEMSCAELIHVMRASTFLFNSKQANSMYLDAQYLIEYPQWTHLRNDISLRASFWKQQTRR